MKIAYSAAQHLPTFSSINPYSTPTYAQPSFGFSPGPQQNLALLFSTMQTLNALFQAFSSYPAAAPPQPARPSKPVGYSPQGEPRIPADALATAKSMIGFGQGNHNGVIVHPNGPNGMWVVSWQSGGGHTTVHVDPETGDGNVMYGDKPVGPTVATYEIRGGAPPKLA